MTNMIGMDNFRDYFQKGMTARKDWKIGTEHEKFAFYQGSYEGVAYAGAHGIGQLLENLAQRFGWDPIYEENHMIALKKKGASITLEPGGQIELSGAPLDHLHQTFQEVRSHLEELVDVGKSHNISFLGIGHQPLLRRDQIDLMPKERYRIMYGYMPKMGNYGVDMMKRTATIQVNLDYENEQDMIEKFRIGLAVQPLVTALFASSPFVEGKLTGLQSSRARCWLDTDQQRTGPLSFVFDQNFCFDDYISYILDVPMYFICRQGRYHNVAGASFRDFMAGRLQGHEGDYATMDDFENHLTEVFPDVRLKTYLEMRGADSGPASHICALSAFWVGLLYDDQVQKQVLDLIEDWSSQEREFLRAVVPEMGLKTPFRNGKVEDLLNDLLKLSYQGLARRGRENAQGMDERIFLEPLDKILQTGMSCSDQFVQRYQQQWDHNVHHLFDEYAY